MSADTFAVATAALAAAAAARSAAAAARGLGAAGPAATLCAAADAASAAAALLGATPTTGRRRRLRAPRTMAKDPEAKVCSAGTPGRDKDSGKVLCGKDKELQTHDGENGKTFAIDETVTLLPEVKQRISPTAHEASRTWETPPISASEDLPGSSSHSVTTHVPTIAETSDDEIDGNLEELLEGPLPDTREDLVDLVGKLRGKMRDYAAADAGPDLDACFGEQELPAKSCGHQIKEEKEVGCKANVRRHGPKHAQPNHGDGNYDIGFGGSSNTAPCTAKDQDARPFMGGSARVQGVHATMGKEPQCQQQ